jgi:hypothetical protein
MLFLFKILEEKSLMIAIGISTGGLGGGEGAEGDLNSFSAFLVIQGQVFQYICCQGHGYTITIPKGHGLTSMYCILYICRTVTV